MQILLPALLGGAPSATQQIGVNRAQQGYQQQIAGQGLTGSGLAAKGAAEVAKSGYYANDASRMDMINRLMTPAGSSSRGISGIPGLMGGVGGGLGS
jgi:hypothetical protein